MSELELSIFQVEQTGLWWTIDAHICRMVQMIIQRWHLNVEVRDYLEIQSVYKIGLQSAPRTIGGPRN